jgi:hypothetical protein
MRPIFRVKNLSGTEQDTILGSGNVKTRTRLIESCSKLATLPCLDANVIIARHRMVLESISPSIVWPWKGRDSSRRADRQLGIRPEPVRTAKCSSVRTILHFHRGPFNSEINAVI